MITGGCLCGAVRFRAASEPVTTRVCWCRLCQHISTGGGTVNAVFRAETVTVEGELRDYVSVADSGTRMRRRFCPVCGSHLFSLAESRPHLTIIRVGALDDRERVRPQSTIWTAEAPSWACIDPDIPAIEGQPPPAA